MADPEADGYDVYETQEALCRLVIASCHPPGVHEPVEAPLDQIA